MNISAKILPELTPIRIIKDIISAKNFLIHSGNRVVPEPHASLSAVYSGTPQPPPASKVVPSAKNRVARRVKPGVSE
jgi:hypothetical protein